jgi:hypothetical protein
MLSSGEKDISDFLLEAKDIVNPEGFRKLTDAEIDRLERGEKL